MAASEPGQAGHRCRRCQQDFASAKKLERHRRLRHAVGTRNRAMVRLLVLVAAVGAVGLVAWQMADEETPTTPLPGPTRFEEFRLADDPFMGNASAPVVIVEMGAPRCQVCQYFHLNTLPDLKANYLDSGRAVLYYSQFTAGYDLDLPAGIAQECAHRVGGNDAFWALTDVLYRDQARITQDDLSGLLESLAQEQGLDAQALLECYKGRQTQDAVESDWRVARAHGAQGTPTFFVFGPEGPAKRVSLGGLEAAIVAAEGGA